MSDISLNFINRSEDESNVKILIFQKNTLPGYEDLTIAWRVIQNCGRGDNHPFIYSTDFALSASDEWGNYTPRVVAGYGDTWYAVYENYGNVLKQKSGASLDPDRLVMINKLGKGTLAANVYCAGNLLALKTNMAPGDKAMFNFDPTIWIGAVTEAEEGQKVKKEIVDGISTELTLTGIKSADIVMTGGGKGAKATPFDFQLENVVEE